MENTQNLKALAEQLPDSVKSTALSLVDEMSSVVEGIGDEPVAWRPGFLRLVQGTTDRGSIPKGTAIGDFVLGEEKLEQPLEFIPIRIWDGRQFWDPDQNNAKMLCWSPDAKLGQIGIECKTCPRSKWKEEEGGGSDCNKIKTALVIKSDLSKVFTITFSKSNYASGMELENLMKKANVMPYQRTYALNSATSTKAKNVEVYKVEVLDDKKRRTPDAHVPFLKELFEIVKEDRKKMIDVFYENAKKRQEQLALNGEVPLALEGVADAKEIATETDKANVSPMAKGYTV